MTDARFYHIADNGTLTPLDSLKSALEVVKTGGYIWLDYYQPKKEDLTLLVEPLGLHPLSIQDSIDESQIPSVRHDHPSNTFILFNAFHYSQGTLSVSEAGRFPRSQFPGNGQQL